MKPEAHFKSHVLRPLLRELGFEVYYIESPTTEPGAPDIHAIRDGLTLWIETKATDKMPSKIDYRDKQPLWLANYWRKGGLCFTINWVRSSRSMLIIPGDESVKAWQEVASARKHMLCFSGELANGSLPKFDQLITTRW